MVVPQTDWDWGVVVMMVVAHGDGGGCGGASCTWALTDITRYYELVIIIISQSSDGYCVYSCLSKSKLTIKREA
jgi:hypothetical protein